MIKLIPVFLMLLILPNLSYGATPDSTQVNSYPFIGPFASVWKRLQTIRTELLAINMKLDRLEKKYPRPTDFTIWIEGTEKAIKKTSLRIIVLEKRKAKFEKDNAWKALLDSLDIILDRAAARTDSLFGL